MCLTRDRSKGDQLHKTGQELIFYLERLGQRDSLNPGVWKQPGPYRKNMSPNQRERKGKKRSGWRRGRKKIRGKEGSVEGGKGGEERIALQVLWETHPSPEHKSKHISLMLSPQKPSPREEQVVWRENKKALAQSRVWSPFQWEQPGHSRWSASLASLWPMPSLPLLSALSRLKEL